MSQEVSRDVMNISDVKIKDLTANPAPLGLMGFGMTTVLLNIHNAGFYPMDAMILSMGFFYGGIAQIIAGLMEWKKGNTFGTTAFTSYGLFWLTLVGIVLLPKSSESYTTLAPGSFPFAAYLFMWGVFTLFMFVGTLKGTKALSVVFLALAVLFFLLAAGNYSGNAAILRVAGYEGIFTGAAAIYTALGQVLNEAYGKKIVPL
ncbi:Putative regulatory protein [Methanosarcina horonobensis HB-1 = JCM 15518]|uniref:Putative regulatory protein n=1 Tax=Methanosarcina horonobensis HB-1 = JCM 15518 TaxID=1434110 RepID=A0A0E3S6T7_9EURY|nr:GPR1/FUN34/YaaH family transporter [Methanosarcina horonobensis]AKB76979.1 Putative regulatory protein [Methanosarcina horonobensis HB-1 = JCM 15518]